MKFSGALGLSMMTASTRTLAQDSFPLGKNGASGPPLLVIFQAVGGWDPILICDPRTNDSSRNAVYSETIMVGDIKVPDIPLQEGDAGLYSIRSFFEEYGENCVVFNGVNHSTVNHEPGTEAVLRGKLWPPTPFPGAGSLCAKTHAPTSPMPVVIAGEIKLPSELVPVTRVDGEASLDAFNSIIQPNAVSPNNPGSARFLRTEDLESIRGWQRNRVGRLKAGATLPRQIREMSNVLKVRSGEPLGDFTSGQLPNDDFATLQQVEVLAMAMNAGFTNSAVVGVDGFDTHKDGKGQPIQRQ
ncbi:MAG: hypothetical protein ACPG4T_19570, partial [Nannocystaceae bacterium]